MQGRHRKGNDTQEQGDIRQVEGGPVPLSPVDVGSVPSSGVTAGEATAAFADCYAASS